MQLNKGHITISHIIIFSKKFNINKHGTVAGTVQHLFGDGVYSSIGGNGWCFSFNHSDC